MNRSRNYLVVGLLLLFTASCVRVKPTESPATSPVAESQLPGAGSVEPGEVFQVKFETSKGDFLVEVYPGWAPRGAAQFRELVETGFFNENRFFRVVPGFVVQWGINGDPQVQSRWRDNNIPDDPVVTSNERGTITFATSGPDSRTTQLFINFGDNTGLDGQGFSPFGKVIEGMDIVDKLNAEYGEQPDQGQIQEVGNEYLSRRFPRLDYIKNATVIEVQQPAETLEPETPEPTAAAPEKPADESPAPAEPAPATPAPSATPAEAPKETIEEIQ